MPERGTVVVPSCGRDEGMVMAVVKAEENAVWLANGKQRPLSRPKRKNIRHITFTGQQINESSMATDRELRRVLRALSTAITEGG